jgi:hypothetical protein
MSRPRDHTFILQKFLKETEPGEFSLSTNATDDTIEMSLMLSPFTRLLAPANRSLSSFPY